MNQPVPKRGKRLWWILLLLLTLLAGALFAVLSYFHLLPARSYTAEHFGITEPVSPCDADGDGIDDYHDILLGARAFVASKPKYKSEYYENAYPPAGIGVCTDVVWYAFQTAGYDLRGLVDADILLSPDSYPEITEPDNRIDFRRVVNLQVFFERNAEKLTTGTANPEDWQPGDIVIYNHHIAILSDRRNRDGLPYIIHHGGQPMYEEDALTRMEIIGHYRWTKTPA